MSGGNGDPILSCKHPNIVISMELNTVRCPDCGYSKQHTADQITRLHLLHKALPRLDAMKVKVGIKDPYDAQALICLATCILRDAFGAKVEQILWSTEVFYRMAKIRLGRDDEEE